MFTAYMQKANLTNYNFQFILLTFLRRAPSLHMKFQPQNFWSFVLTWCCQRHLMTHTSYLRRTTLKTFPFPPLAVHTRHFGCVTVTDRDRPTFVECYSCLPTWAIISVMSFPWMNRESLYEVSSPPLKKEETVISYRVSSLVIWFVNCDANTFVFLGYVLRENGPSFEQVNNLSTARCWEGL
jgi:hypothetical protein